MVRHFVFLIAAVGAQECTTCTEPQVVQAAPACGTCDFKEPSNPFIEGRAFVRKKTKPRKIVEEEFTDGDSTYIKECGACKGVTKPNVKAPTYCSTGYITAAKGRNNPSNYFDAAVPTPVVEECKPQIKWSDPSPPETGHVTWTFVPEEPVPEPACCSEPTCDSTPPCEQPVPEQPPCEQPVPEQPVPAAEAPSETSEPSN